MITTSFLRRVKRSTGRLVALTFVVFMLSAFTFDGTVRGRLNRRDGSGRPYPAVSVRVTLNHAQRGRSASSYTGTDGIFYLQNVPAGTYNLEIWPNPDQPIVYTITVSDQGITDIAPIVIP